MSKQFANRDVSNLTIYRVDNSGNDIPYALIDYANVSAVDMTGEVVYAYGGQGHPKKVSFAGDRGGTLRVESQIGDGLLYSMLTGAELEDSAKFIKRVEVEATDDNKFHLDKDYVSGSRITAFYGGDDLNDDERLTGTFSASLSTDYYEVTYTPNASVSGDGFESGAPLYVYYTATIGSNVKRLNLTSTTFPKTVKICGDTWDKDEHGKIVEQHMVVYKAVPQPGFTISNQNTGDPGTITITYDILENESGDMLDLIFVGTDQDA